MAGPLLVLAISTATFVFVKKNVRSHVQQRSCEGCSSHRLCKRFAFVDFCNLQNLDQESESTLVEESHECKKEDAAPK